MNRYKGLAGILMFLGPVTSCPKFRGAQSLREWVTSEQGRHLTVMFPSVSVTSINFRKQFVASLLTN